MVKVVDYIIRKNSDGKPFVSLELQGDLMMVQSLQSGSFYATSKRCSITSTFSEEQAKLLIGKELPGSIQRVQSDAYDFTVPETGEVILLTHRWQYFPDEAPATVQKQAVELVA